MIDTYKYAQKLSEKIINRFKKEYYDKIGLMPTVAVYGLDNIDLKMEEIEDVVNSFIPIKYKNLYTIKSPTRKRDILNLKKIFIKISRDELKKKVKEIGRYLNGIDHSTVVVAYQVHHDLVETDENYKQLYENVLEKITLYKNESTIVQYTEETRDNPESIPGTLVM